MNSLHLFQPQYANLGPGGVKQYWLPYSVGCLWSYAQSFEDITHNWTLSGLHYKRDPVTEVLGMMHEPDLCAFSCYVWNEQYNLTLARSIKQRWPDCKIVFGGPQAGSLHLKYNFIDCIIFSEGEQAFVEVLRRRQENRPIDPLMRRSRLDNLDIPSPYLTGVFDLLIQQLPAGSMFQTVLETNRGCPYACTYCDWGGLTYSKIKKFQIDRIQKELEWIKQKPISAIFLTDANVGIFKERDLEIARLIKHTLKHSRVDYIALNFTKNSNRIVFDIAKELVPLVKSVSLSMQTMNPATLKEIKRDNLKSNDFAELLKLSQEYNIPTYTDMILGLPLETLDSWKKGLMKLIELGSDGFIDTNFLNILWNTEFNLEQLNKHQYRTVKVRQYQDFVDDQSGIDEYTEIAVATSTMPIDDMVAAWMWHWLVQFYHTSGYSNWLSRYLHYIKKVDYLDYYETLMAITENDSGPVGQNFRRVQKATQNLLYQGDFGNEFPTAYEFYIASYPVFYEHRKSVFDLAEQAFVHHNGSTHNIIDLQRNNIFSPECKYHEELALDVDISNWENISTLYVVRANVAEFPGDLESFKVMRRGGFWKNTFVKTQYVEHEIHV